ncbi:energy transducer TonB [Hymenobacter cheonanensis]|uniref:energy transducer TonB n=1 Tax=Hymenobacter sp. CA2-7 TaxID=3063993 RepID=UPI00271441F1|nr:energy transducer TonB [Hymenobacter sp. CA2-7]MDO7884522.1 TonB family protein [Hymenobacter sp. CA2-7]
MKYLLGAVVCASLPLGQAAAQQVIPPLKQEFLDSTWHVLPSAAGAYYRRETEYTDSTAGVVRDYFLSNGQLQSREELDNVRRHRPHGVSEFFNKSGQLRTHAEFDHGRRTGELVLYYPSGQLKRRERYTDALHGTGECFAPDGTAVPFFEYEIMPRYSEGDGGFAALVGAIGRNFNYTKEARRAGIQGRVLVTFSVTAQGLVDDVKITQPLHPLVDAEAVSAVYRLRRFTPGQQDGKPVKVSFTAPITLKLQ